MNTSTFGGNMRQAQPIAQQPARQPFADATKNQNKITTDLPSLGGDNIIKKPHMEYETYKVGCKILLCVIPVLAHCYMRHTYHAMFGGPRLIKMYNRDVYMMHMYNV